MVVDDEDGAGAGRPASRKWPWVVATARRSPRSRSSASSTGRRASTAGQAERAFQAVTASNETLAKAIEKRRIAGDAAADASGQGGYRPLVLAVPFGEQALNPARLESVRTLVAQLERAAINGVVRIESFNGSFCLANAGQDGYTLAPPTSPASQCDQVGNPFDESMASASRQPIDSQTSPRRSASARGGAIELELTSGPRDRLAVAYPVIEQATAGQWNAAAQSNNRIEISIVER